MVSRVGVLASVFWPLASPAQALAHRVSCRRFGNEWKTRPTGGSRGQSQAGVWAAHTWPRPPTRTGNYSANVSDRRARFFSEPSHGPYDRDADEFWPLLIADQGSLLKRINDLNLRDVAFYEFALEEFARRLDFFELDVKI